MVCYVYLIQAGPFVKIGVSEDIAKRIDAMQTGSPHALVEIARLPFDTRTAAYEYESHLHRELKRFHYRGEWFHKKCIQFGLWKQKPKRNKKEWKPPERKLRDGRWQEAEMEIVAEARNRL